MSEWKCSRKMALIVANSRIGGVCFRVELSKRETLVKVVNELIGSLCE